MKLLPRILAATLLASAAPAFSQALQTQAIPLQNGWNLIQFQVAPTGLTPAGVFGTTAGFKAIWHYDAFLGLWQVYQKPQGTDNAAQLADKALLNGMLPLGNLAPGQAYWVYMTAANTTFSVSGQPPVGSTFPAQDLAPGWNMVGFPIGGTSIPNNEPISLLAVLTAAGFDYDAILTWETGARPGLSQGYKKLLRPVVKIDPLTGLPVNDLLAGLPADAPLPNYTNADLSQGYWLRVTDPAVLKPRLVATVRPEVDVEPRNNFPGREDVNIVGLGGPRSPRNVQQIETIRFFPGEDVQTLSISNLSGTDPANPTRTIGGGIMIWEAVWEPITDTNTTTVDANGQRIPDPWIKLYNTPGERVRMGNNQPLPPSGYTSIKGVTTLENDIVYLRLDRKNLGRGEHRGTLTLKTSVGDKVYAVAAETGGLEGDWKGYATITTVNGKRNRVPDIDLFVSFFEDPKTDGLLRGLIDSSNALLWPVDVPLAGYRLSNAGNTFTLGGSFALPPGDQNNEPFDAFAETPVAGNDVDWNNNNGIQARNPFPFPIQRTVTFEGALITGNPTDGYIIEGDYNEIVHGMMKEPIKLIGRFHIERQALTPLSSRRSITADTGVEPVISKTVTVSSGGTSNAGQTRPTTFSSTNAIAISTELELRSLQVGVQFAALPHSNFKIRLRSPDPGGLSLVLFDGTTTGTVAPKSLEKITFPADRPTHDDLGNFIRTIARTKGDPLLASGSGLWRLDVTNSGPEAITLQSWSLRLEGQPVTDVQGIVRGPGNVPVSGATVTLQGLPFSGSTLSAADGKFTFSRVPIMPLNFTAVHPAFTPANPAQPGLAAVSYLTPFSQTYLTQAGLTLSAAETALRDRFNPLAGAPIALDGVDGFAAGTDAARFQLDLVPGPAGPVTLVAGPLAGTAGNAGNGHTVDFYAMNAAGTVLWDFGDGTTANTVSASHEYTNAGHYRATLKSPANSPTPQGTVDIVVMPTVRKVPLNPNSVPGFAPRPAAPGLTTAYPAYCLMPTFNGGGSLPMSRSSGTVGVPSAPDVYALGFTEPVPVIPVTSAAVKVGILTFQHTYAASMDLDLAPYPTKVTPPTGSPYIPTHLFSSDGFDAPLGAFVAADFTIPLYHLGQGFKQEDFNYTIFPTLWTNTRLLDRVTPEFMGTGVETSGGIVWGNSSPVPDLDYSLSEQRSRDNNAFTPAADDQSYHPHPGTSEPEDNVIVSHFVMTCSIGGTGTVFTAPTPPASVKPAKDRHLTPDESFYGAGAPALVTGSPATAGNLYFTLHTGSLAVQPRLSGDVLP